MNLITLTCQECHYKIVSSEPFTILERGLREAGWYLDPGSKTIICATCMRIATLEARAIDCQVCG